MGGRGWRRAAIVATVLVLTGWAVGSCAGPRPADPDAATPDYWASNTTTLDIGLFVNGQLVALLAPGQSGNQQTITMPPLPWTVEARTATGRVLGSTSVAPGQVGCTPVVAGHGSCTGALILVDLVCGRFEFVAGMIAGEPAPIPGAGEPCEP